MRVPVTSLLSAVALSLGFSFANPRVAEAYPVDCAILLCLAGGWPASAECTHAREVFIRRITPWPIEPPLQIWRCPMHARFPAPSGPIERLIFASIEATPAMDSRFLSQAPDPRMMLAEFVTDGSATSDIDISGREFDFVRSIRVWDVMSYSQREHGRDDDCEERYNIKLGSYGIQGGFSWSRATPADVPHWMGLNRRCSLDSFYRAVGVEWQDQQGINGHEVVHY